MQCKLQGWGANPTPRRHRERKDPRDPVRGKDPDGVGPFGAVPNIDNYHDAYWGAGYGGLLLTGPDLRGCGTVWCKLVPAGTSAA